MAPHTFTISNNHTLFFSHHACFEGNHNLEWTLSHLIHRQYVVAVPKHKSQCNILVFHCLSVWAKWQSNCATKRTRTQKYSVHVKRKRNVKIWRLIEVCVLFKIEMRSAISTCLLFRLTGPVRDVPICLNAIPKLCRTLQRSKCQDERMGKSGGSTYIGSNGGEQQMESYYRHAQKSDVSLGTSRLCQLINCYELNRGMQDSFCSIFSWRRFSKWAHSK